ncbi:MAG: response regulator [Gammaproteobacteria bacterium]|nr:MAG: response regulator [Gammaproteobacteria bacterium]
MSISSALVVDDSRLARIALSKLLKTRNIIVDMAGSGAEAIEVAEKTEPDVIFMDYMMPDMDGYETTRKICTTPTIAEIPVVMCTSQDTEEDRKKARDSGAKGFLTKPTTQEVLNKVIDALNRRNKDNTPKEETETVQKQSPKSEAPHISLEQIKSVAKQAAAQVAEESAEKISQKIASIAAEDALSVAMKEIDARIERIAENKAHASALEVSEKIADNTSRKVANEVIPSIVEKTVVNLGDKLESSMTDSLQKELSSCLEDFINGDDLRNKVKIIAKTEADTLIKEMTIKIAKSTAEETTAAIAKKISEEVATETAKAFARTTAEEIATDKLIEIAPTITGKAVKTGVIMGIIAIAASAGVSYLIQQLL